ncbi:Uma2 family endonuclease [Leptolyngbya sp. FACHB-36]|uniref:Uma2 family endonuclease n=1 Tax=Leptolyngbya sp. FACHB-36 TaxID=2692808 RepID=UPI001680B213|nr:Uma2 family endonuclease [Leptolyngbya sp. FACHB-36]MBD2021560.1 Uma2 family endonuclease [Leptolyngbya sp. FACHB-36]
MVLQVPQTQALTVTWEQLPADFVLPDDPVENIQQPLLAAALTDALAEAGLVNSDMLLASNFGLVATVNSKTVVKAPDWLFVPKVAPVPPGVVRRSYTPMLEGDPVAVVMEFLSETDTGEYSVRPTYPYGKLYFYEHILKVPIYVIFNPSDGLVEVRQLQDEQYIAQQPDAQGRYWIPELQLFLGTWYGKRLERTTHWLRWWDEAGNLLLWSAEKAEQERQRVEQERQRAEQERQRAEQEHQRAEQERQRAETAEAELARLRALLPPSEQ